MHSAAAHLKEVSCSDKSRSRRDDVRLPHVSLRTRRTAVRGADGVLGLVHKSLRPPHSVHMTPR